MACSAIFSEGSCKYIYIGRLQLRVFVAWNTIRTTATWHTFMNSPTKFNALQIINLFGNIHNMRLSSTFCRASRTLVQERTGWLGRLGYLVASKFLIHGSPGGILITMTSSVVIRSARRENKNSLCQLVFCYFNKMYFAPKSVIFAPLYDLVWYLLFWWHHIFHHMLQYSGNSSVCLISFPVN